MHNSTTRQRVLVADDDPRILRIVSMILENEGLEVITAEDGEEALEKAISERPDAILLDIEMPKMGGIEVCSKLKANKETAEIPIGFVTAHKEPDTYKQVEELGSVVFIPKPFQPEKLVTFVIVLLSSKRKGGMERRRTKRVQLYVPVVVKWVGKDGSPREEVAATKSVNAHGCQLSLKEPIVEGVRVEIVNRDSGQARKGRVVMCSGASLEGRAEVAIELEGLEPRFWGERYVDSLRLQMAQPN